MGLTPMHSLDFARRRVSSALASYRTEALAGEADSARGEGRRCRCRPLAARCGYGAARAEMPVGAERQVL
jgi:hypothetical protein